MRFSQWHFAIFILFSFRVCALIHTATKRMLFSFHRRANERTRYREIEGKKRTAENILNQLGAVFSSGKISLNENSLKLQCSKYAFLHFNFLQNVSTMRGIYCGFSRERESAKSTVQNMLETFHFDFIPFVRFVRSSVNGMNLLYLFFLIRAAESHPAFGCWHVILCTASPFHFQSMSVCVCVHVLK